MNEIDRIRKRMKKRKDGYHFAEYNNTYEEKKQFLNDGLFNRLYKFMVRTMVLIILVLAFLTYIKLDPKTEIVNSVFNKSFDFSEVNTYIQNTIGSIIPFFGTDKTQTVSGGNHYENISENYYKNDSTDVVSINTGVVTYVGTSDILGSYIIVEQDNDIVVTYGNLIDVAVSLYDRVTSKEIIAKYDQKVLLVFEKDGEEISYLDAIKD